MGNVPLVDPKDMSSVLTINVFGNTIVTLVHHRHWFSDINVESKKIGNLSLGNKLE